MVHIVSKAVAVEGLSVSTTSRVDIDELDGEWVQLILTARHLGLELDEIRRFLRENSRPEQENPVPTDRESVLQSYPTTHR